MKRIIHILKLVGPWVVGVGIIVYLFRLYPLATVVEAGKGVNIISFSAFALFYFFFVFAVDTWVFSRVLTRFHHPVKFKELLPARAVTYLIMILNYGAGQGAFAYYLKRTKQVAIFEVLGIFAFIALIDLYWLMGMAVVGSFFQDFQIHGVRLAPIIRTAGGIAAVALAAHLIYWRYFSAKPWRATRWLREKKLFRIFHEAKLRDYLVTALMRTPIHACIIASMYVVLITFGAYVPFLTILGATPIAFILGVLPISPSGIGVTNGALVELLQHHIQSPIIAQGATTGAALILAASLLWIFANLSLKAIVGSLYLMRVSKDLFVPPSEES